MAYVFLSEVKQREVFQNTSTTPSHVGPGYYDTKVKQRHKRSSSAPFSSKQERILTPLPRALTPGPGAYNSPSPSPSPSVSHPNSVFASNKSRFEDDQRNIPGPGAYTPQPVTGHLHPPQKQNTISDSQIYQQIHTPPSVPTSNYGYDVDIAGNLHPHQPDPMNVEYSPVKTTTVKKGPDFQRGTGRKAFYENTESSPGPGDYNLASKKKTNGAAMFAASRAPRFQPSSVDSPGPGDYHFNSLEIGKKHTKQKYQHPTLNFYDNTSNDNNNGDTKIKPTIIKGSNVKRKVKKDTRQQTSSPGPGEYSYDPNHRDRKSKSVAFAQSSRFKDDKPVNVPGPGYYDTPNLQSRGPAISNVDDRFPKVKAQSAAGPGSYNLITDDNFSQPSSMFASTTGRSKFVDEKTPCPPMYNSHKEIENKGVTIPHSTRFDYEKSIALDITPGPGSYESPVAKTQRAVSPFARGRRFTETEAIGPGPVKYSHTESSAEKKSFNKYLQG